MHKSADCRFTPQQARSKRRAGFTMVELLVALAIIAVLLTIAAPKYFASLDRSREQVLRENLYTLRESLDKYFADQGRYPDTLNDLVTKKYMRSVPYDPLTESAVSWILIPPSDTTLGAIYDVRSGAAGKARDGTWFKDL